MNRLEFDATMTRALQLRELGRTEELGELLSEFARRPDAQPLELLNIVGVLRDSNRYDQAIKVMRLVLARDASQAVNHFRLARLYQGTGQHEAALQAYRETLQRDASLGGAWLGLAGLQKFSDPANADWRLILSATVPAENTEASMCLAFARGKGHDDLRQYEQAWNEYLQGNRLRRHSQPWEQVVWNDFVQKELARRITQGSQPNHQRRAVFIVGMLRSGTTLLEQLLDQHPSVIARGELNFLAHAWANWQIDPASIALASELSDQLWKHMRLEGPEDLFYIDKNPLNFRFLSLLAAAMPEAKILHLRRDGRDSCLSCFMQLFQHPDTAFSCQLDDLVDYYRGYLRLMQYFKRNMPAQILTLDYAELVTNTDKTLAAVEGFLNLKHADSGSKPEQQQRPIRTASAWQARQAVHRNSLGRWQNYHAMAPGFFDRIAALDQEFHDTL